MQLVRKEIHRSGRDINVAWIDTQGIDLGIDTIHTRNENETEMARIESSRPIYKKIDDTEDDDDNSDEEVAQELVPVLDDGILDLSKIYFYIDTYKKLAKDPIEMWDLLLSPANNFLAYLNEEDSKLLCLFYIDARKIIDEELIMLRRQLTDVATTIGNKLYDLSDQIGLPEKLVYYCKNYDLPFPDLSYAGTRVGQDREEMTFKAEEYYQLMAISILCKLLGPIWGDLIYHSLQDIDTLQKESHCVGIILPVLEKEQFKPVSNKLYYYVSSIVNTALSSSYNNASFSAALGGFSTKRIHDAVYSVLLVKRYVNVDFFKQNGNLMVWTSTCAKSTVTTLIQTLNKKCHVMKRIDISDGPDRGGDEESNVSVLEHSSRVTTVTADVPVLIKIAVRNTIKDICIDCEVSELELKLAMTHYTANPIQVSVLNRVLVGLLLGNRLGGAKGLKYLSHLDFTKLVAVTQLYMANHIQTSLVHLLTASTPSLLSPTEENQKRHVSDEARNIDARINNLFNQSGEYRDCEKTFPYAIDNISLGGILLKLKDHIIKYNHFANTAPSVSTTMDQTPLRKGVLIEYDEFIMRNLCFILLQIINKEKQLTSDF